MKKFLCLLLAAASLFAHATVLAKPQSKTKEPPQAVIEDDTASIPSVKIIRVLLDEQDADQESKFIIKSPHGFVLESPTESNNTAVYQKPELHLLCKDKTLYLQCRDHRYRRIKYDSIEICSPQRTLTMGGSTYQGSLVIRVDEENNSVLVINKLPLEDYVYSVVRYESIPSWPLAMQKVQAIISRTYATFLMQQARLKNPRFRYFDLKNTNIHQVYNGTHNYTHLRQAVDETSNLILTHKGNVALTMFDICCGGAIPAHMRPKDCSKPYLARQKRCTFCQTAPSYQWKEDLHITAFLNQLKNSPNAARKLKHFNGPISEVKAFDCDKAGLVHRIKLFDKNNKAFTLTGNDIRTTSPHKIKSLSFNIKKIRDRIVITGKGYGHQRGVCQWGCKEMVSRGWSIKGILNFYYPGTKLSRLL